MNLNSLQRKLSKSRTFVHLAVKLRNQANMIVGYHLGESCDHLLNGEASLIRAVAPYCQNFVDVGANVGDWSELFLSYCPKHCEGLLFEPGNAAYEKLISKFHDSIRTKIIQVAVGNEVGYVDFFEEPNAGITSSVIKGFTSNNATSIQIRMTTLDHELTAFGWNSVDYLKIDTEGFDYQVLLGAKNFFSQKKLGFVQFEYNHPWANTGATLLTALNFLEQHGYLCYLIRSDGLYKLNYSFYQEYFRYSNFLAVNPDRKDAVEALIRGEI